MNTRQRIILFSLGVIVGYGIHDIAYESSLNILKGAHLLPSKSGQQTVLGQASDDQFVTTISYDRDQFTPRKVRVRVGNYVRIINKSKTSLLWLNSDMPGVGTNRGYAEGEQFQFASSTVGSYIVTNKLHTQASLQITIDP